MIPHSYPSVVPGHQPETCGRILMTTSLVKDSMAPVLAIGDQTLKSVQIEYLMDTTQILQKLKLLLKVILFI